MTSLAVVIVNYRSWEPLAACLASLADLDAEIVVVDNASGDGRLGDFASDHPDVRFIQAEHNFGFAYGCNLGAALTRAPLLLFLNPDTRDPGGQLASLAELAESHPEAGIFSVRQVDERGRPQRVHDRFPGLLTLFGPVRSLLRRVAPRVDWVSGSVLLIRRALFERLGGWDPGYWMYSEDVDLCWRAHAIGHRCHYFERATVIHQHGGSSRRDPETTALTKAETTISRHYFAARHFGRIHAACYHAALFLVRFLPVVLAAGVRPLLPLRPIRVRARVAAHLLAYYRRVLEVRTWRSPRAAPGESQGDNS
ncbi:MAG: glycosyltransferase family 2 protein [Xanthomonadales bacterium]|nr:glycosyltransferase family 2 protein [Xanthomonadales bacterium]